MDFAKKILIKNGWKDGSGLGRNMNGIVEPLKANLKFDTAGFGADQAASDFNNHWWERVFNEASSNIAVQANDNGVSMDLKNRDESVEITTKSYSVRKLKKRKDRSDDKYGNFLQSSLLTQKGNEINVSNEIEIPDIEVKKFKQLTDQELFKACGGRTAHKGARHGLNLSGKLARLEMQEQEMLTTILAKKKESAAIVDKRENAIEDCILQPKVKRKTKDQTKSALKYDKTEKRKHNAGNEIQKEIEREGSVEVSKVKLRAPLVDTESVPNVKIKHVNVPKDNTSIDNNLTMRAESKKKKKCTKTSDNVNAKLHENAIIGNTHKKCKKRKNDRKRSNV